MCVCRLVDSVYFSASFVGLLIFPLISIVLLFCPVGVCSWLFVEAIFFFVVCCAFALLMHEVVRIFSVNVRHLARIRCSSHALSHFNK